MGRQERGLLGHGHVPKDERLEVNLADTLTKFNDDRNASELGMKGSGEFPLWSPEGDPGPLGDPTSFFIQNCTTKNSRKTTFGTDKIGLIFNNKEMKTPSEENQKGLDRSEDARVERNNGLDTATEYSVDN